MKYDIKLVKKSLPNFVAGRPIMISACLTFVRLRLKLWKFFSAERMSPIIKKWRNSATRMAFFRRFSEKTTLWKSNNGKKTGRKRFTVDANMATVFLHFFFNFCDAFGTHLSYFVWNFNNYTKERFQRRYNNS